MSNGQGLEPGAWRWPGDDKAAIMNEYTFIKGAAQALLHYFDGMPDPVEKYTRALEVWEAVLKLRGRWQ